MAKRQVNRNSNYKIDVLDLLKRYHINIDDLKDDNDDSMISRMSMAFLKTSELAQPSNIVSPVVESQTRALSGYKRIVAILVLLIGVGISLGLQNSEF
jgi:hypothetical protein